jgi:hypothetical protein
MRLAQRAKTGTLGPSGMPRVTERGLITAFRNVVTHQNIDRRFRVAREINFDCKSRDHADVEYVSATGRHFVIEAKSHHSKDRDNGAHKIFGELLKETGRNPNRGADGTPVFAILLTDDPWEHRRGEAFYRRKFQTIDESAYLSFGRLVKAEYVFLAEASSSTVRAFSWAGFYRGVPSPVVLRPV